VEYAENERFADIQRSGPFAYWYHRHRFEPGQPDSTIYTDEIDYALPFGPIGRILSPLAARRLERLFEYRHRTVARLIKSEAR
jgi:ligand-binding SRPBCC domain-containing protein